MGLKYMTEIHNIIHQTRLNQTYNGIEIKIIEPFTNIIARLNQTYNGIEIQEY